MGCSHDGRAYSGGIGCGGGCVVAGAWRPPMAQSVPPPLPPVRRIVPAMVHLAESALRCRPGVIAPPPQEAVKAKSLTLNPTLNPWWTWPSVTLFCKIPNPKPNPESLVDVAQCYSFWHWPPGDIVELEVLNRWE